MSSPAQSVDPPRPSLDDVRRLLRYFYRTESLRLDDLTFPVMTAAHGAVEPLRASFKPLTLDVIYRARRCSPRM